MDEPENLMIVNSVLFLREPVPFERYLNLVASRLDTLPRLRQRIVKFGKASGALAWETDPHLDLSYHVQEAPLERPDQRSLQDLIGRLMSVPLDPRRPPWQIYFVPQYEDGCAVILRVHHCVGDGVALLHMLLMLTDDPSADRANVLPGPQPALTNTALGRGLKRSLSPLDSWLHLVQKRIADAVIGIIDRLVSVLDAVRWLTHGVGVARKLLFMRPVPAAVFKGPLSDNKCAVWSRAIPVDALKALARDTGSTINDVALAAVAGGLRRYLLLRELQVDGFEVRGVVPVNLRRTKESSDLGNRFGLVFVPLPLGIDDPLDRISAVRNTTRKIKRSPEARLTFLILRMLGIMPSLLFETVVNFFGHRSTVVMTNVIGPREPMRMAETTLKHAVFWVPCSGHLGLGFSIFSYVGNISLGIASDGSLVPDPEVIIDGFESEMATFFELSSRAQTEVPTAVTFAAARSTSRA